MNDVNVIYLKLNSNQNLHPVIIKEAIEDYMRHRGYFCWVDVEEIDKKRVSREVK